MNGVSLQGVLGIKTASGFLGVTQALREALGSCCSRGMQGSQGEGRCQDWSICTAAAASIVLSLLSGGSCCSRDDL